MQFPITRNLQILSSFTAKNSGRPELACVNLQKNYAQATDSHTLMRITNPKTTPATDKELNICLQGVKIKLPKDNTVITMDVPTESEQFPDADVIIKGVNKTPALASVTVNAEYLANICKAVKELDGSGMRKVTIEMRTGSEPVVLKATAKDGADVLALLMPIRV